VPQDDFAIMCGDDKRKACNASWDMTTSKVSIPAALSVDANKYDPRDPRVTESVCYTGLAETYLVEKFSRDEAFWSRYNVTPGWTYFGAHDGMFRQIPATYREKCGSYDPHRRPWFVAASSGPKDIVLVLDVSGSMGGYGRFGLMKEAAITVIETLSVADKVAVVIFGTNARVLNGQELLVRATKENKDTLIAAVKKLRLGENTNFHRAFLEAFSLLERTFQVESTTGCHVAVLFMTDGTITTGPGSNEVIQLVEEKREEFLTDFGRTMTIFSFSLGNRADEAVTKTIACSTGGIWIPVGDNDSNLYGNDIISAMSSYYKLFALGMGDGGNDDFVAWVEPHEFFHRKRMGTTVSAPVYDRSVTPHLFLGVVAIDAYMEALERILGEDAMSSNMLQRFVDLSTARCPKIELAACQLDALRFSGSGDRTTCGSCTDGSKAFGDIVPKRCSSNTPSQIWANTDVKGKKYFERACCHSDLDEGPKPSEVCKVLDTGAIVGISCATVFVAFCTILVIRRRMKSHVSDQTHVN